MNSTKKTVFIVAIAVIALAAIILMRKDAQGKGQTASAFVMDTMVTQKMYSQNATSVMQEVNDALRDMEGKLSMYLPQSEIVAINAAAGKQPVEISEETFSLLADAKKLSLNSDNTFAVTIAPISAAWGITSKTPRVVPQAEREELLKLVNDNSLILENNTAFLQTEGQGIDLGGIAKGAACDAAKEIYEKNNVDFALLNMGGSCIYVKGVKPNGEEVVVGFRDPTGDESASIASFTLKDKVFSTSGGYERFFEENGIKYHHIIDPKTGAPAVSDIVSIGVMCENGAESDFLSTSLFIKGKDKALEYMKNGGTAIVLDADKNLYVSKALESSFELIETEAGYNVIFI